MADPSNIDKLAGNINAAADALRRAAPEVWAAAHRQVLIESALEIIVWVIFALLSWKLVIKARAGLANDRASDVQEMTAWAMLVVAGVLIFILILEVTIGGASTITTLINPDYAAVKLLVSTVTK